MSDPVWPESLPTPISEGYSGSYQQPVISTEMEQGPSRKTRISDTYMGDISCTFVLDKDQQYTFREFYDNAANAGADWVLMPLDGGSGTAYHRVRINSVSFTPLGPCFKNFTLSIETEDRIGDLG